MKNEIISLLIPFLLVSCSSKTNNDISVKAPKEFQSIRNEIIQLVSDEKTPSFSVAVLKDKKVIWKETFEKADSTSNVSISANAQYPLASLTKSMSATVLLKLVERGEILLDDPIDKYLPDGVKYYGRESATVKELVSMTSGIPHGWMFFSDNSQYAGLTNLELLPYYGMSVFPKGIYEYSNYSFGVVEALIESVSHDTYSRVMQKELFDPLGMKNSFISTDDTRTIDNFNLIKESGQSSKFLPSGGAGAFSTINDLILYSRLHLKEMDEKIVSYNTLDQLHNDKIGSSTLTALGWGSIALDENLTWLISNGSFPNSANSNLTIIPENKIAIICLTNRDYNSSADITAIKIADVLLPGFADKAFAKMENYESANSKKLKLNGSNLWEGMVKGGLTEMPISFSYEKDSLYVTFDDGDWKLITDVSIDNQSIVRGGNLTVTLKNPITNQMEEAKGNINLLISENNLQGYLSARFIKENVFDIVIPYFVIAHKVDKQVP